MRRVRNPNDAGAPVRRRGGIAIVGIVALALVGAATLVTLTVATERSRDRSIEVALDAFDDRGELAARLLSDAFVLSSVNNAPQAQAELSGPLTTESLDQWEGEQDPTIPYTVVFDGAGRLLAAYPAGTRAADTPAGREALAAAREGQPGVSGTVEFQGERVVELFIPYTTTAGAQRVMVAGVPADVIRQVGEGTLQGAAGSDGAGSVLLDRAGTTFTEMGRGLRSDDVRRALADAARSGRTRDTVGDRRLSVHPVEHTGLVVGLAAPEGELFAGIPDPTWPRLALGGLALALLGVVLLGLRLVRARRQVEAARAAAERANDAKGRFLAHVAHELKTPIAVIRGFADLLRRSSLDERQRDFAERIDESGDHLLRLADDLLEVSRIEAGRVTLALERIDVRSIVEEVLVLAAPLAADRRIRLEPPPLRESVPAVLGDQMRVRQVLLNLLSNAIKYNRDSGVVRIAIEAREDSVRISIEDTGVGIAPEHLDRLFEPFERLEAERGPVHGSGLGLSVTKGLVEAMGGMVDVESSPGEGSTFSFELPATNGDEATPDLLPAGDVDAAAAGRLVYIDDNAGSLELVERIVAQERPGLELRTARDGGSGLELVRQGATDLLLLDLNLPDMHGESVLQALRARADTAGVPILIVSADSTSRDVTRLLRTGADAYLTKPLDRDQFLSVVDRLLGAGQAVGAP